jgi:hypothetical protein
MAGVRIPELIELPTVEPTDHFVTVRNNRTRKVAGNAFYQAMSGVKSAFNLGAGEKIFKGTIGAVDGTQGTTLQFNTLSAGGGLEIFEEASNLNVVVQNQGINNLMLADGSVDAFKIAQESIAPFNMGYTGAILNQNITQANFLAYTNNTNWVYTGFSVSFQAQHLHTFEQIFCMNPKRNERFPIFLLILRRLHHLIQDSKLYPSYQALRLLLLNELKLIKNFLCLQTLHS